MPNILINMFIYAMLCTNAASTQSITTISFTSQDLNYNLSSYTNTDIRIQHDDESYLKIRENDSTVSQKTNVQLI